MDELSMMLMGVSPTTSQRIKEYVREQKKKHYEAGYSAGKDEARKILKTAQNALGQTEIN